jgi:hypothetical protein
MKPRSSTTDAPLIRDLLSYRLHVVANLLSRGAELRYGREFGVSLWEWRTIALLGGAAGPQSLNELARAAEHRQEPDEPGGVRARGARAWCCARSTPNDARGVRLTLTRAGRTLYQGLIRAAAETATTAFLDCLGAKRSAQRSTPRSTSSRRARSRFIERGKARREMKTRITELLGIRYPDLPGGDELGLVQRRRWWSRCANAGGDGRDRGGADAARRTFARALADIKRGHGQALRRQHPAHQSARRRSCSTSAYGGEASR